MCLFASLLSGKNSQVVSEYPSKSPATACITAYCFMAIELKFAKVSTQRYGIDVDNSKFVLKRFVKGLVRREVGN